MVSVSSTSGRDSESEIPAGKYVQSREENNEKIVYKSKGGSTYYQGRVYTLPSSSDYDYGADLEFRNVDLYRFEKGKGSTSYGDISSASSGAYPANSYSGSYWYVSLGSDIIDPSAVSYDINSVIAGQSVIVTISPSSGNQYGGTITYSIEVNVDESGWEPYTETTSTSFTFTIPEDAVSWRVRVKARDNMGFTSSTYVYGNNAINDPTTVIYPSVFAVMPEDKNLGFLATNQVVTYLVTTKGDANYQISVTLDDNSILNTTETSKARILTVDEDTWDSLSGDQTHTIIMTVTQGDEQIVRTYKFRKFLYSWETLHGLFTGLARATRIKRSFNRQLVAADLPKEILKISSSKENTTPSYIDVVLPYVEGGTIIIASANGDIYGADIDPSGTTRVTVDYTGVYTVQGYAGDSPSSSASVTIVNDGDVEKAILQWIKLEVTALPMQKIVATKDTNVVDGTSNESGVAELYLPTAGVWSLTATNDNYNFPVSSAQLVEGYGNYTSEVDFVSPVFGENSWETIARVVKEGKAESYWNVGDCKAVTLNGTIGE